MSVQILIVEDDKEIARILCDHLRRKQYVVTWASTGNEGWEDFQKGLYQLVIVDLMLPEMDGFTIIRHIRLKSEVPILIISAKNRDDDKVKGLRDGADDYLTKPFSLLELEARIESHLRRYQQFNNNQYDKQTLQFYPALTVDLKNKIVRINHLEVLLTNKELALLELFVNHPGRIFSKKELYEHIWHQVDVDGNNTITVHIKSLRTKLADPIRNPVYIQTVWGIGYRFIGEPSK